MAEGAGQADRELERLETQEWIDALDYVVRHRGKGRALELLDRIHARAAEHGLPVQPTCDTAYVNTIALNRQPPFPGDRAIERRIKSIVRWNAMAMVVRANRESSGIGGHISTFASAATLYEVGFNHFFRGPQHPEGPDQVYFQGHAAPGNYARAFLEDRISERQLHNFRQELRPAGGLPSYPHPWLLPGFWQFATVSMGLGPVMAVYQARFNRYLRDRGLLERSGRVWAFVGDGEMDEPESLAAVGLAGREALGDLIMVVNCNLQRLDGPVRGNDRIIQELETLFRGAGWRVIKVVWGSDWDPLFARDTDGVLLNRLEQVVDGDLQKYAVESGAYIREHFFGSDPRLQRLVEDWSDEQLRKLNRGGHDPVKVYAAYRAAVAETAAPTVVLAQTIKGYGLGEAGEGRNITHQQKKLNEQELREFRRRFDIPIADDQVGEAPFYRPSADSPEMRYLQQRRAELGGHLPQRQVTPEPLGEPAGELFDEFLQGSDERDVATTMALVRLLGKLLKDETVGPRVVPIIPDEARTFGMDALFRRAGIYAHQGQRYEPVDREHLIYYREDVRGQILEEGITEAGSMSSFIAAGTSYSVHGLPMIPFFTFYSMFGFQRVGDLIWAAGDMQARGFLVGGTAGRTSLPGEGLQHQDGHSHLLALAHPTVRAYDPAYAYEIAVIVREGLRRMFQQGENLIYYLTVGNQQYPMPAMPPDSEAGILRGLYRVRPAGGEQRDPQRRAKLLGSGAILGEALDAAELLEQRFDVPAEVYSATSYQALLRDGLATERRARLQPQAEPPQAYLTEMLGRSGGVTVAASDYVKALPAALARWVPGDYTVLGTDGFGRSDNRGALRDFFEVDAKHIAFAALAALARGGQLEPAAVQRAGEQLGIDPDRPDPATI